MSLRNIKMAPNRLLYKFENGQKKFDCVGSFGYAPTSVKFTQRIGGQK